MKEYKPLTVSELIKALKKFPGDLPVGFADPYWGFREILKPDVKEDWWQGPRAPEESNREMCETDRINLNWYLVKVDAPEDKYPEEIRRYSKKLSK